MKEDEFSRNFDRIILVDKPAGISSFATVSRIRWQLTEENFAKKSEQWEKMDKLSRKGLAEPTRKNSRIKVGHAGTLDPFATGLLIILTGKNTKKSGEFLLHDKTYFAKFVFGATSTTGDPEGEITPKVFAKNDEFFDAKTGKFSRKIPTRMEIESLISRKFLGEITQIPPLFSAIKMDGKKAYEVSRKSENGKIDNADFAKFAEKFREEKARKITVFDWKILDYKEEKIAGFSRKFPVLTSRIHVSSGTYIRSLAEDLGRELGTGAFCSELRREKIAKWDVKDATIEQEFFVKK